VRWIATTLCASCGAALLVAARALDGRWFERHVLLPWYYPHVKEVDPLEVRRKPRVLDHEQVRRL